MEKILINMSLPSELVEKADARAKELYKTRTEYIKDLIIDDLRQISIPL